MSLSFCNILVMTSLWRVYHVSEAFQEVLTVVDGIVLVSVLTSCALLPV